MFAHTDVDALTFYLTCLNNFTLDQTVANLTLGLPFGVTFTIHI